MTKEQIEKLELVNSFEGLNGYHEVIHICYPTIFKGTFLNGKREGLFEELGFFCEKLTGEKSSGFYKNDMKDGMWVTISEKWNGRCEYEQKEIYNYFEDEKEGQFFLYENKILKKEGTYHNGMKNGLFKTYFKYGIMSFENFKNDKKVGYNKSFYINGQVETIENYNEHGELHGLYESFFEDGSLERHQEYFNDVLNGYSQEVTEFGITESGHYDMGRKVGEWVYADLENGKGEIIIYNNPPELSE